MNLTESPLPCPDVTQQSSTHQKHERYGDQGPSMHGIESQPTRTTERGNSTYHQQVDTEYLHRQNFTPNISQCQLKHRWTQQHEY